MATDTALAPTPRLAAWLRCHPWTLLFLLFAAAQALPFCLRRDSEWDDVYVASARRLVVGDNIYDGRDWYLYPPFAAWCAIPFTWVGPTTGRVVWYALNLGCLVALCRGAWLLAGGRALDGIGVSWREHAIFTAGLLCAFRYVMDGLAHQQTDVVIAAALMGGCVALARGRPLLAAVALGLAAAVKCTALLWVPYLLWRGQWKAAVLLVAVAVGANLLPNLASTPDDGGLWVTRWYATYVAPLQSRDAYPGVWGADIYYNQALAGAGHRFFVVAPVWDGHSIVTVPRPHPPSAYTMQLAVKAIGLVLGLAAAFAIGRPRWTVPAEPPGRLALECSIVLLLMLLLSPMSSKPHFCTMLLPALCLARLALVNKSAVASVCLVAAMLFGFAGLRGFFGVYANLSALWWGVVTWSALCLLLGCWLALWRGHWPGWTACATLTPRAPRSQGEPP